MALAALPVALVTFPLSGCTVIGLTGGAIYDAAHKDPRGIALIHRGARMKLNLRDGRVIDGRFAGRGELPREAYLQRWATWPHTTPVPLPSPGDSALLTRKDGSVCAGRLAGYTIDGLVVEAAGGSCSVAATSLRVFTGEGGWSVQGPVIAQAIRYATIPITTTVLLDTRAGPVEVPLHEIRLVQGGRAPRNGKVVGCIVGLGVDIAMVAIVVSDWNKHSFR